mmetsp:Transcript_11642/g.13407  ORF Transcript_11642/g.13407 Transcript_11642/m.13407 type:complete len:107 (+) Transcript_11642:871-1191(+)
MFLLENSTTNLRQYNNEHEKLAKQRTHECILHFFLCTESRLSFNRAQSCFVSTVPEILASFKHLVSHPFTFLNFLPYRLCSTSYPYSRLTWIYSPPWPWRYTCQCP